MNKLVSFCLRNRGVVLVLTLALTVLSILGVLRLPVDVFPELKVPRVTIQTEASGLSAEEVEQYVSIPLEAAMRGTPGVKDVRTSSGSGLSFVWVDFDWDTDVYRARQIVSERLAVARNSLPPQTKTELAPIVSLTGEIMLIALTGDEGISPLELRRVAEFRLRNALLAVPGVGQVTVLGGRLPEYQVLYDPEKLRQTHTTLDSLKDALTAAQSTDPSGYLEDVAGQELPVQQATRAMSAEHLRRAPILGRIDGTLRVEDVARVTEDGAPRRGNAGYNGQEAVIVAVQKVPGANTLELTGQVEAAVRNFALSELPKGIHLHPEAYRQADFITLSLENGERTLLLTAVVVMLVILLTLLNIRTALITLVTMPLSVLLGMACFPFFGLAVNIMTLGGLAVAVGDVVDNAIIFVEIAWRHLNRNAALPHEKRKTRMRVLMDSKSEIVSSISYSSVIILLVFSPILFLSGLEGQFYRPLGISYMLAMSISLVVALTLVPVLCLICFKAGKVTGDGDSVTARFVKRLYSPILRFCMKYPKSVTGVLMLITLASLALASTFGTSFLPPFNEDCYTVFVNTAPGTSLAETERISRQVMREIGKIPGVRSVAQRTGRAENDEHAEPVSSSELLVRVDLTQDQHTIRQAIRSHLHHIPGASGMIGFPLAHRISSALSGSNSEIAINIYGTELADIRTAAARAAEILSAMPEVADARANREVMVDSIRIVYNREILATYGLSVADAARQVSSALYGFRVGEIVRNLDHRNVVLRIDPRLRCGMDDVRNLQLVAPGGKALRLGDAAHVYREEVTNLILRDNSMRKAMISCNPAPESNLGDLARACRRQLEPAMHELGCRVDYAGVIKSREEAESRLYILGGVVCGLIVLLLASSLGGIKRALITLINIPLCLVGGILAVFLASPDTLSSLFTGHYIPPILSVSSLVGFITVVGFAIRSGLILINRYRSLETAGIPPMDAIRTGSLERVIPIMMTSLTTILGLLPLVWARHQPGGELLAPLAIVQLGGLISATLLNLLAIPAVYSIMRRS